MQDWLQMSVIQSGVLVWWRDVGQDERVFSFAGLPRSDLRKSLLGPNGGLPVFLLVEVIFIELTLNFVTNIPFL